MSAPNPVRRRTDLPRLWLERPTVESWQSTRRPELLGLFADHVYGRTPAGGFLDDLTVISRRDDALGGRAVRTEADVRLGGPLGTRTVSLLVYTPHSDDPVPAFLGLNFQGNHSITLESDVRISLATVAVDAAHGRRSVPRGAERRRWPLTEILDRGYAVATVWYEELEVDLPGHASSGVRGLFAGGDHHRGDHDWGAIGGWAWSLSRLLDALAEFDGIDHEAVIAVGHSRLGKTALWAAAQDQRFAGVITNGSGCGGASLFRHRGVEDIRVITSARPHWFAPALGRYRDADETLPVDQHQLIALQAPRPTHVSSATRDAGADPIGEYLSTVYAGPAFELYGHLGIRHPDAVRDHPQDCSESILPQPGSTVGGQLSYHLRDGDHDLLAEDWRLAIDAVSR